MAEPAEAPRRTAVRTVGHRIEFTADGWEYFRLWITNVALTLLTLGVYSAWAKVRTRRYLYGHARLGGETFDFTADPVALLPGRFIGAVLVVALWLASLLSPIHFGVPVYYVAGFIALAPLFPWVVVRARSFNLGCTRWRHVAFGFSGSYGSAALWYPLAIGVGMLTFGIAWPYLVSRRDRYLIGNSRFGASEMRFNGRPEPYYRIYGMAIAVYIGLSVVLIPVGLAITAAGGAILGGFVVLAPLLFSTLYIRVRLANYRWQHTRMGATGFDLNLDPTYMMWLYASNIVLIACTAGLFIPFARLRVLRYRLSHFQIGLSDDPDAFRALPSPLPGAVGSELGQALELDIGG